MKSIKGLTIDSVAYWGIGVGIGYLDGVLTIIIPFLSINIYYTK